MKLIHLNMFMSRCCFFYEFSILKVNDRGIRSAVRVIDYGKENALNNLKETKRLRKHTFFLHLIFFAAMLSFNFSKKSKCLRKKISIHSSLSEKLLVKLKRQRPSSLFKYKLVKVVLNGTRKQDCLHIEKGLRMSAYIVLFGKAVRETQRSVAPFSER